LNPHQNGVDSLEKRAVKWKASLRNMTVMACLGGVGVPKDHLNRRGRLVGACQATGAAGPPRHVQSGKLDTQIDHVLVADTGIFVIETKHYGGWILGHPDDPQWTQTLFGKKSRFQNPLRQNYGHVKVLQFLFDLSKEYFHTVIVFIGDAKLKPISVPT
jgi:hypothetical protein